MGPLRPDTARAVVPPAWWNELRADRPVVHVTQGALDLDFDKLVRPTLHALAGKDVLVVAGITEDKPEVGRRVSWSGVGIDLRTKTPRPERIRAVVRAVLNDPAFKARATRPQSESRVGPPPARGSLAHRNTDHSAGLPP